MTCELPTYIDPEYLVQMMDSSPITPTYKYKRIRYRGFCTNEICSHKGKTYRIGSGLSGRWYTTDRGISCCSHCRYGLYWSSKWFLQDID